MEPFLYFIINVRFVGRASEREREDGTSDARNLIILISYFPCRFYLKAISVNESTVHSYTHPTHNLRQRRRADEKHAFTRSLLISIHFQVEPSVTLWHTEWNDFHTFSELNFEFIACWIFATRKIREHFLMKYKQRRKQKQRRRNKTKKKQTRRP